MSLRERIVPDAYVDENGDVLPYADVADNLDSVPPSNSSIVQGMTNLETVHQRTIREARLEKLAVADAKYAREEAVINHGLDNPGVVVSLEQRYQDELDLMNLVSGANQRGGKIRGVPGGFEVAHKTHPEILERYGPQLPNVAKGAHGNHLRMVNRDALDVYHAKELIEAGVAHKEEIEFDAKTMMVNAYRNRYYGTEQNDHARQVRRRFLNKMIALYATK